MEYIEVTIKSREDIEKTLKNMTHINNEVSAIHNGESITFSKHLWDITEKTIKVFDSSILSHGFDYMYLYKSDDISEGIPYVYIKKEWINNSTINDNNPTNT